MTSSGLNFLTLVTFGRSGSTALQAAINAHPHVVLRGENYNAFVGLWRYWTAISEAANRHHSGKPENPWFGTAKLNPQEVLKDLRTNAIDYVFRPKKDTRWTGFKEVRYEQAYFPNSAALVSYLLFLQELFPGLCFMLNTRNPERAARSGWWGGHPNATQVLTQTNTVLRNTAGVLTTMLGSKRVQLVDYDVWKEDPEIVFRALSAFDFPASKKVVFESLSHKLIHGKIPEDGHQGHD